MDEKYLPLSFSMNYDIKFKIGDFVKILNADNQIIDFAYITKNSKIVDGVPVVEIISQKDKRNIRMVITDAIQKI